MAKNNKKKKPNMVQKQCIKVIKEYLNEYAQNNLNVSSVEFFEQGAKSDVSMNCEVAYKDFTAIIKYSSSSIIDGVAGSVLDILFKYEKSDYCFSIYDIFNLFDIDDFKLYYYQNCVGEALTRVALDELMQLVEKHYNDIKSAGNQTYFPTLMRMAEKQQLEMYDEPFTSDLSNEIDSIDRMYLLHYPIRVKSVKQIIRKFEKYDKKNKLTLYEKRLLKYLKADNEYDIHQQDNYTQKCTKIYRKISRTVHISIWVITFAVLFIAEYFLKNALFADGYIPMDDTFHFGLKAFGIDIPYQYLCLFFGGFTLSGFFSVVIGSRLVIRLCKGDVRDYAVMLRQNNSESTKLDRIVNNYLAPIGLLLFCAFLLFVANIGISFTDNGIRCFNVYCYVNESYENIEIYKVNQQYKDGDYVDYDGVCYAIAWDDDYYVLDECQSLGETEKVIFDISTKHDKQIKLIDNQDVLFDMYKSEVEE